MAREVTCLHRHLSAIPGGRFACSDDLGCRSVFTLTTDGEVEHLRAMYAEGVELIREGISVVDDLMGSVDTLMAQRDAARDAARICEQALVDTNEQARSFRARVRGFAARRAISTSAIGDDGEHRAWLDLLRIVEEATPTGGEGTP